MPNKTKEKEELISIKLFWKNSKNSIFCEDKVPLDADFNEIRDLFVDLVNTLIKKEENVQNKEEAFE